VTDGSEITHLSRPHFPPEVRKAIASDIDEILASGRLMMGPWSRKFEEGFMSLTGRAHAVSVNSCTTALQIALTRAEVAGKDVLVPSGSFLTDVSAVQFAGGQPILVDMNPETLAFDRADLARKLTPNTRAIIWVHLTGVIASDYAEIVKFAKENALFLIEDAAHAHGSVIDGRPAGSFGDASTFSFYPTKILTSGTGGMLTTDDREIARFAREMRMFGKQEGTGEIVHRGNDWFLDEIRACVGYHHLGLLQQQVEHRRAIADRYADALANQPGFRLLEVPQNCHPAWYQYPVFLSDNVDRAALISALKEKHGIEAKGIYRPTHEEVLFRDLDDGTLTQSADTLRRSLCLPMHAEMTADKANRVAAALVTEIRQQIG